ncbi:hypothetical protein [Chryseobacterium daeguense]|uniref:hypothetical protein n=1 Tax=Chryseobacterium daeguense TaxID=412438 RepID=UPI00048A2901|nr:hypothetical protein [Chryseobacterium daeguense]
MKNLVLAAAFAVFGLTTVSAQTTPQKRDTVRPDTTRTQNNMRNDNMNNNNNLDKSKTDTANWKNKDAVKEDKKMKRKNK